MSKLKKQTIKNCIFCKTSTIDDLRLGELMVTKNITSHYFCCLLSTQIRQLGRDNQGINGFLPKDIMAEVKRGSRLTCKYCKKKGATIKCANNSCKMKCHLPCAIKAKAKHEFFGVYRTYCAAHVKKQKLPDFVKETIKKICAICTEIIDNDDFIWAECCARHTFLHHVCAQRFAISAGYDLKCPNCNNIQEFKKLLERLSVFIPDRMAAWELEENAFADQMPVAKCSVDTCLAKTRVYNVTNTLWEIIACEQCSVNYTHRMCSDLKLYVYCWHCDVCKKVFAPSPQKGSLKLSEKENCPAENVNSPEQNHNIWTQRDANISIVRICVALACKSAFGRRYENDTDYSLIPCLVCGNLYVHRICDNVTGNQWLCQTHKTLSRVYVLVETCC